MINTVAIMGRLTYEPELRSTVTGTAFTNIQIACDRSYQPSGKERQADFIDCRVWGKTAEFVARHFHKGEMIAVTGSIRTDNFTDDSGVSRKAVTVTVNEVSFCGSKQQASTPPTQDMEIEEIPDYDEPC